MRSTFVRRAAAGVLAGAVAAGTTLVAAPAEAAPNASAFSAARWLDDQLTNGLVHNEGFGGFDDYGLTLDVFFALESVDSRPDARTDIIEAFEAKETQAAYTDPGFDFGPTCGEVSWISAGGTGKLATAVELDGSDPRSFNGVDLVTKLEGLVHTAADDQRGRATDVDPEASPCFADVSNSIGQSFVVRALAGAERPLAAPATGFLLKQQCSDGFFRVFFESSDFSCDSGTPDQREPSVDATAYALLALLDASAAGADLGPQIDRAADWLVRVQAEDGSFSDAGTPNADSTGLAAGVLARLGRKGPAGNAAAWLQRLQVTDAVAADTALANELGAIAYTADALADGKLAGVDDPTARDQWRRATAPAAVGVNALLPAKTLAVRGPVGYVRGRSRPVFRASGLEPGERFAFLLDGRRVAAGTADSTGRARAGIAMPAATRRHTVRLTGSRPQRGGTTAVSVLGATTLGLELARGSVRRGGLQRVTVTKLVADEPVKVFYKGRLVKQGRALANRTFAVRLKVGKMRGTFRVKVVGAFANRTNAKTFRIR